MRRIVGDLVLVCVGVAVDAAIGRRYPCEWPDGL